MFYKSICYNRFRSEYTLLRKNTPNRENYSGTKVLKSIFPAIRTTESIICSVIIIK